MKMSNFEILQKVLLCMLISIICGAFAIISPGMIIQYQVITDADQPNAKVINQEGFLSFNNNLVVDALPCIPHSYERFSDSVLTNFLTWQSIGKRLSPLVLLTGIMLFLPYAAPKKNLPFIVFYIHCNHYGKPSYWYLFLYSSIRATRM